MSLIEGIDKYMLGEGGYVYN